MRTGFRIAVMLALLGAGAWIVSAAPPQNLGAPDMMLEGGTSGDVPFPHLRHQQILDDCGVCHDRFPQIAGAIETFKAEGKLARREVMNELCTRCHRERRRAGEKSGPTTCTTCHTR